MPDGFSAMAGSTVSWIAVRSEPWREPVPGPEISSSGLHLVRPSPMLGVIGVMFAMGPGAAAWSERLSHSDWYAAMRPRPVDLPQPCATRGAWLVTDQPLNRAGLHSRANEIVSSFPEARLVTVALLTGATPAELDGAFGLVRALRNHAGEKGRTLRVVVTIGAAEADRAPAVATFQQLGATVIRSTEGMNADHLHHFPLRAALPSPSGRLVCVDLADCLMCWPSGRVGELHLIPFNMDSAAPAMGNITVPHRLITMTLIAHFPEEGPDSSLVAIETLARLCGTVFCGSPNDAAMLFTTGDRLDGVTGTADLLLIHD